MKKSAAIKTTAEKGRSLGIRKDVGAWLLLLPSALCMYFFMLRPQALNIIWSFFNMKGFTPVSFAGFDNYIRVFTDSVFFKTFLNTWTYVFWSLLVGLLTPFITAIVLNELVHIRKTARIIVYLPSIMPAVAVSMLFYFVYYPDANGLLNMLLGKFGIEPYVWLQDSRFTILYIIISCTWSGAGGTALYYFAGLQGINHEMYEAALIDGAGFFRRHITVTIPQMSGLIVLLGIRQCINVFNIIDVPMQMTDGGPNNASLSLGLLNYRYAFFNYKPQMAMALSVVMLIVLVLFAAIYFYANKRIEENRM